MCVSRFENTREDYWLLQLLSHSIGQPVTNAVFSPLSLSLSFWTTDGINIWLTKKARKREVFLIFVSMIGSRDRKMCVCHRNWQMSRRNTRSLFNYQSWWMMTYGRERAGSKCLVTIPPKACTLCSLHSTRSADRNCTSIYLSISACFLTITQSK